MKRKCCRIYMLTSQKYNDDGNHKVLLPTDTQIMVYYLNTVQEAARINVKNYCTMSFLCLGTEPIAFQWWIKPPTGEVSKITTGVSKLNCFKMFFVQTRGAHSIQDHIFQSRCWNVDVFMTERRFRKCNPIVLLWFKWPDQSYVLRQYRVLYLFTAI